MTESFLGSRLHVGICLLWIFGVQAAVYFYNGGWSFFNVIGIPISLISLMFCHLLIFALLYVFIGWTP